MGPLSSALEIFDRIISPPPILNQNFWVDVQNLCNQNAFAGLRPIVLDYAVGSLSHAINEFICKSVALIMSFITYTQPRLFHFLMVKMNMHLS